ncbi:hypothetical protein J6590_002468 [Homalodisca vitripennis]|nr:hypothetical protein J6590_002468 [Homalodisca vitripennis]
MSCRGGSAQGPVKCSGRVLRDELPTGGAQISLTMRKIAASNEQQRRAPPLYPGTSLPRRPWVETNRFNHAVIAHFDAVPVWKLSNRPETNYWNLLCQISFLIIRFVTTVVDQSCKVDDVKRLASSAAILSKQ